MKTTKIKIHGECTIKRIEKIPSDAIPVTMSNASYHIIADSETTGNHHVLDNVPGMKLFSIDDLLFAEVSTPTKVRCIQEDRHDTIELEAGIWEFGIQKEYDYLSESLRNVRD
jgi:hypothetical protein